MLGETSFRDGAREEEAPPIATHVSSYSRTPWYRPSSSRSRGEGGLIYNSLGCRTATALVTQRALAGENKLLAAVSKTRANAFSYSR